MALIFNITTMPLMSEKEFMSLALERTTIGTLEHNSIMMIVILQSQCQLHLFMKTLIMWGYNTNTL